MVKREAKALGISVAEVIRRKIDTTPVLKFRTRPDPSAIKPFLEMADKRTALAPIKKSWRWNREELYEERISRYGGKRVSD
jgi:hypothetical protein